MRELTGHKINPANDVLRILVTDPQGSGGAHHRYTISGYDPARNPSFATNAGPDVGDNRVGTSILFQNGPIASSGVNGLTHEALLAILIDRLRSFQAGQFACEENGRALANLEAAQAELLSRTKARIERGVEGTHSI